MEELIGKEPEAKDEASLSSPGMDSGSKSVARSLPFEKHFLDEFDEDSMPSPICPSKVHTPSSKMLGYPAFMSSPSPAHKMPGSGTRNELYLKTVMSSPYQHKSYTPLSATPAGLSPMFQTPIRSSNSSPSRLKTPQMNKLPPGFPHCTPKGEIITNPFDNGVYDELGGPIFMSPGVFNVQSTPDGEEKKLFSWAIEHIAELNPADIEENPKQQAAHSIPDKETEARVQQAIEKYFSSNLVAPSPWSDPKAPVIKTTPNSDERLPKSCLEPDLQGSIQKQLPQKSIRTQEVGCQTMLTLPIDFDINKVLGQYMTYELSDENNQEMLSTSSLRRKLFFQADTSSVAPSPVKAGPFEGDHSLVDICASPRVLPVKHTKLPDTWDQATPLKTPSRNQFSSSPIKNIEGLPLPKHSRSPPLKDFSDTELSPIVRGHQSRISKSRSSGFFVPHEGSFVEDDIFSAGERRALFTQDLPLSPEISPIKTQMNWDVSPDEGRHPSRTSLESPGISPIRSDSPYNEDNADGSFLQDNKGFTSEEEDDVLTPVASKECSVKKKSVSNRKISHLSRHKHRTSLFREDLDNTPMDYDSVPPIKNLRFADDIKTSSLLVTTKDFSMAEMDFSQDNNAGYSTNHDTGYQTASLQSTNHDTGQHTNLTSQFNSLPFNTTNQEVGCPSENTSCPSNSEELFKQDDLHAGFSGDDSAFMSRENINCADTDSSRKDVVQQLLDLTNLDKFEQEDEILDRARRALSVANKLLPSQDTVTSVGDSFPQKGLQILHELEPLVSTVERPALTGVIPSTDSNTVSASEKALAILRRAGEDLAKIGTFLEQRP
ncbi:protein aurora borealis-like [Pecten maximus]|uniref:protein aurora borealis-like n=1 Tax=Pecten maximus TaxID=6579 RepID=UPI001458419C|nr:protein aurora borealis-like [Pecten maximus]XP_033751357.1 protein aurora borealis-like [Pecten maximus]